MKPRSSISILNSVFTGYRRYTAALVGLATLSAILDSVSIVSIIPILSLLMSSVDPSDPISNAVREMFRILHIPFQFRYLLAFVAGLVVVRSAVLASFVAVRARANSRFMTEKVRELYGKTLEAKWMFVFREKAAHLQNTIFWDVKRTGQLLDSITQFSQSASGFLIYLAVALNISAQITLITLIAGVVVFAIFRPLIARARRFGEESAILEKDIAQHIGEHLQGFKLLKTMGASREAMHTAVKHLDRMRHVMARSTFIQSLSSMFVQPFTLLFAIGLFAFSYYAGNFNIASFAAALYLIQKIFTYLDSMQVSANGAIQLVPYAEHVLSYLEKVKREREQEDDASESFMFTKSVLFDRASLEYREGSKALSNVSFSLRKGTMVGIVGPSGGGKTSIADLLLRLVHPTGGVISVDGIPIERVRIDEWRKNVGYVSQDAFLLHASIRDNIRFYDEAVSDADIESAARAAHIFEDIMRLPDGFDTVVGDRGAGLSGGQKQRVALARALARKPQILVLDEVTSALDSELEAQIQEVIRELRGKMTLIVIAHRISTVFDVDEIVVVSKGEIVETGSPQKLLLNKDSYFSRIAQMQRGEKVEPVTA